MSVAAHRWARQLLLGGAVVLGGCGEPEHEAVTAAKAFALAARSGQAEDVLALVDAQTRTRVEQAAERASDQVGGRRSIAPEEMLQVVDVDPRFQVSEAELEQGDEGHAVVKLVGADDSVHTLELVNEDGAWRVRLPLPRGPMGES